MQDRPLGTLPKSSATNIQWLISFQYFIIGASTSLGSTMVLSYPHLPAYSIISLFTAAHLPFSFKFLLGSSRCNPAPFIERYTCVEYGKRKTWMIAACFLIGALSLAISFFTEEPYQIQFAVLYFFTMIFSVVQSISVIAYAIKELEDPAVVSFIQEASQSAGDIFGSLIFLKLISSDFARNVLGRDTPLCSPSTFFVLFGVAIILLNIAMHFLLKERVLAEERLLNDRSLWEIIKQYRVFLNARSRYFRQALFFLIINQGHMFFLGGFNYELIKKGFSKERINEIGSLITIPVIGLSYIISRYNTQENLWRNLWIVIILKFAKDIIMFIVMPLNVWVIAFTFLFGDTVATAGSMYSSTIILNFPVTALSGMFITALNSARNFGGNSAIHQRVIHEVGWPAATIFGFVLHAIIIGIYWHMVKWIEEGEVDGAAPRQLPPPLPLKEDDRPMHADVPL